LHDYPAEEIDLVRPILETAQDRLDGAYSATDMTRFFCQSAHRVVLTRRVFAEVADKITMEGERPLSVLATEFRFAAHHPLGENHVEQKYTLVGAQELTACHNVKVPWRSGVFLGEVTKNEGDCESLGRVQVLFDWEDTTPAEDKQCWVDVVTPYAGSAGEGFGILMLPEVGEKVMVRFLEPWDDKPIIVGSLRREKVSEELDTAKFKVIRTPGGNRIDFISDGGKETIRVRTGKADDYHIQIDTSGGKTQILVKCNDDLKIEGKAVSITGDTVSIESRQQLQLKAGSNMELTSSAGTNIKSDTVVVVKGQMIQLN